MIARTFRQFVSLNQSVSRAFDRMLPGRVREDGNSYFHQAVMPDLIETGMTVYDLGGGSRPFVSRQMKQEKALRLVGLDISAEELDAAPDGLYDRLIVADLCTFRGGEDGDLVICQATLEHVPDVEGAIGAIASCLKPGGRAAIFAPSRHAVFARLNMILPEDFKKRILFALFPQKALGHDGFKAYYDKCTPRQIEALFRDNSLVIEQKRLFWMSSYFSVLFPVYVVWRAWQFLSWCLTQDQAAETFCYVVRKTGRQDA